MNSEFDYWSQLRLILTYARINRFYKSHFIYTIISISFPHREQSLNATIIRSNRLLPYKTVLTSISVSVELSGEPPVGDNLTISEYPFPCVSTLPSPERRMHRRSPWRAISIEGNALTLFLLHYFSRTILFIFLLFFTLQ